MDSGQCEWSFFDGMFTLEQQITAASAKGLRQDFVFTISVWLFTSGLQSCLSSNVNSLKGITAAAFGSGVNVQVKCFTLVATLARNM